MAHSKATSTQSLRQSVEQRLREYTRQATSFQASKVEAAFGRNLTRGVLAAVVPLAASAGDAAAQCASSAPIGPVFLNTGVGLQKVVGFGTGLSDAVMIRLDIDPADGRLAVVAHRGALGTETVGLGPMGTASSYFALSAGASVQITQGKPNLIPTVNVYAAMLCQTTAPYGNRVGAFCPPVVASDTLPKFLPLARSDGSLGWMQLRVTGMIRSLGQAVVAIGPRRGDYPIGVPAHAGNCDAILPVELVSFTAIAGERGVSLRWETASELNNAGFEVQRATQDGRFRKLTFVEGRGTTTDAITYHHTDNTVEPNARYRYRLKQIDFDGTTSFSEIVEVFTEDPSKIALSELYPNPAVNGRVQLQINVADPVDATVEVYDVRGALLESKSRMLNAGQNQLSFRTDDLAAGSHFAKVQIGERVMYRQFVVTR